MKNTNQRIEWIDTAKGLAILLVIMGHMAYQCSMRTWIYDFHMDFFFVLCGITTAISFSRYTEIRVFLKKHALCLLLPYICWNLIVLPFSPNALSSYNILDRLHILLTGRISWGGGYWFLVCLFALQGMFCLFVYLARRYRLRLRAKWCLFLVGIAAVILAHRCIGRTKQDYDNYLCFELATQVYHYLIPFAIGVAIFQYRQIKNLLFSNVVLTMCIIIALFTPLLCNQGWGHHLFKLYGIAMSIILVRLFQSFDSNETLCLKYLKIFGKNSLSIYLFHYAIIEGSQVALFANNAGFNGVEQFLIFAALAIPVAFVCIALKRVVCVSPLLNLLLLGRVERKKQVISKKTEEGLC